MLLRSVRSLEAEQQDLICKSLVIGAAAGLVLLAIEVLTAGVITRTGRWALGQPEGFIFSTAFNRATAVLALVVWPAALVFLRRGPRILAPICVIAGCVLLSQLENLSSTIALIGGIAVFAAVYFLGNRIITALAVLVVAGTLAAPLLPSTILSPEVIRETLPSIAAAQFHRALIWDFAAARILERPLRGWGLNSSRTIPGGDKQISRAVRDRTTVAEADEAEANRTPVLDDIDAAPPENWELLPMHPHNAVLQWWLELGLPGAALGAGLILSLLIACRRYVAQRLEQATCVTVIFSATVISLLSYNIWQSWWLAALWLTTVMVTGVLPVAGRDPPREAPAQPA